MLPHHLHKVYVLMVHSVTLARLDKLPEDGPTGDRNMSEVF